MAERNSTIIRGDKVRVKVSKAKMTTPWEETTQDEAQNGTFCETAYKLELEGSKDSMDTTVFLDAFKTKVFGKKEINITLTCRNAVGDKGQDLIQAVEEANEEFYLAYTRDYTYGKWTQYKVCCESFTEGMEVSNLTDSTYKLALAPGSQREDLTKPEA